MCTTGGCISVCLEGDVLILELKDFYTRYTNDVIATVAFGIGVDSLKQPTNEFYTMGQDLTHMNRFRALKWLGYISFPKLMQVSTVIVALFRLALVKNGMKDNMGVKYYYP
jgi:cytochrome P450 family 9